MVSRSRTNNDNVRARSDDYHGPLALFAHVSPNTAAGSVVIATGHPVVITAGPSGHDRRAGLAQQSHRRRICCARYANVKYDSTRRSYTVG